MSQHIDAAYRCLMVLILRTIDALRWSQMEPYGSDSHGTIDWWCWSLEPSDAGHKWDRMDQTVTGRYAFIEFLFLMWVKECHTSYDLMLLWCKSTDLTCWLTRLEHCFTARHRKTCRHWQQCTGRDGIRHESYWQLYGREIIRHSFIACRLWPQ